MAESSKLSELSEIERMTLDLFVDDVVSSRDTRREKIEGIIEGLEAVDEVTRMVAGICIQRYLADATVADLTTPPQGVWRRDVGYRAPGIFMHYGTVAEDLLATGEFVTLKDFEGCAEVLNASPTRAMHAAEFLFQWVAARNPGSPAAQDVRHYGLKSGRMSHSMYNGDFCTKALLFHESVMREYAEGIKNGGQNRHSELDPIICLTVTDDPELIYGKSA